MTEIKYEDKVNHPSHYNSGAIETIEKMRILYGDEAVLHFCRCNSFKYVDRAGLKSESDIETDVNKAKWYKDYADKLEGELYGKMG